MVPLVVSLSVYVTEFVFVFGSPIKIFHASDSPPLAFADQLINPILSKVLFNFQHDSIQLEKETRVSRDYTARRN